MTRRQIAEVCYVAGLAIVVANLVVDAIGRHFFNCDPDPYFPELCTGQQWAYPGIIVACWLAGTYLLARRNSIGPFACAFMGSAMWLGILGFGVLWNVVRDTPRFNALSDAWTGVLVGMITAVPVIGLLTAVVGGGMQIRIQQRRRRRRSRLMESTAPDNRILDSQRGTFDQ